MIGQAELYKQFAKENPDLVDKQLSISDSFHFSQLNSSQYNDSEYNERKKQLNNQQTRIVATKENSVQYQQKPQYQESDFGIKTSDRFQYKKVENNPKNNEFYTDKYKLYYNEKKQDYSVYSCQNTQPIHQKNEKNSEISTVLSFQYGKDAVWDKKHNKTVIQIKNYHVKYEGVELVPKEKRGQMLEKERQNCKIMMRKQDFSNEARIIQKFLISQKKAVPIQNLLLFLKGKSEHDNQDVKIVFLNSMAKYAQMKKQKILEEEDEEDEAVKKKIFQLKNFEKLSKQTHEEENTKYEQQQKERKSKEMKLYEEAERIFIIINRKKHIKRELKSSFVEVFTYTKKQDKEIILNLMIKMIHDKIAEMYEDENMDEGIRNIDKRKYMELKEYTETVLNEEFPPKKNEQVTAVQQVEFDRTFGLFPLQGFNVFHMLEFIFQMQQKQFISRRGLLLYIKKKKFYQHIDFSDKSLEDQQKIPEINEKQQENEEEDNEEEEEEILTEEQQKQLKFLSVRKKFEYEFTEEFIPVQTHEFKVDFWEQGGKIENKPPFKLIIDDQDRYLQKQYDERFEEIKQQYDQKKSQLIKEDQQSYQEQLDKNQLQKQDQEQESQNQETKDNENSQISNNLEEEEQQQQQQNQSISQKSFESNMANELQVGIESLNFDSSLQSKRKSKLNKKR